MLKRISFLVLKWVLLLIAVSFVSFSLLHISDGDPAFIKLTAEGTPPTAELVESTREEMGLNRPFLVQYADWLTSALQGDFQTSFSTGLPVLEEFGEAMSRTIRLTLLSFLISIVIAFPLGGLAAVYQNSALDVIVRFFSSISLSVPDFYLALLGVYLFALKVKIFPVLGSSTPRHYILPAIIIALTTMGRVLLQVRAAVIEQLSMDYVKGVRALGMPERTVLIGNVLPNTMISILTIMGISFGSNFGGSATVELIFNFKGVGTQVVQAIQTRDFPMIQIYTLWTAALFITINFFIDLSYNLFDPQVRAGHK